jgi:GH15 family glucan-1,4-alpha-glucosidase
MSLPLEQYGLIGDTQTAALVGVDGSIDWLCLPRFDSGACFAALLGTPEHGRWLIAPAGEIRASRHRYRDRSLVLETEFECDEGTVRLVDAMPPRQLDPDVVRIVEGVRGTVTMRLELCVRFDYGGLAPWIRATDDSLQLVAGPDAIGFRSAVPIERDGTTLRATFTVREGQRVPFTLVWHPSHLPMPKALDAIAAIEDTDRWWRDWVSQNTSHHSEWHDAVERSFITLKALTFAPTGGIIAAPTTSLPEQIGGVRNWDYRYCWLRDATFVLYALMSGGFTDEAIAWRDWLLRVVAGDPAKLQIMYGPAGERRLQEFEVPWLPGYEGSRPVRIGNAAVMQLQLDVYGEVMDTLHVARTTGIETHSEVWTLQRALMEYLESHWSDPDEGIWEVRGPRRHFTSSKVEAWLAFDRAIKTVERYGEQGPVDRWRAIRAQIHQEICERGYDASRGTFVQYYGGKDLDASLLLIALVGFLPPHDPRVRNTVAAIERELMHDGFLWRYTTRTDGHVDGLPAGEGAFLACTFWLADNYVLLGRVDEARRLFERLLAIRNELGLLAEQYDVVRGRLVGNFPQALSHVALINTARNLSPQPGPVEHRTEGRAADMRADSASQSQSQSPPPSQDRVR